MAASPITSEVDFARDGKHLGYLRLPHSVHRSAYGWIPIPVASIRGGEGPKVLLMAGNHGDEYEGQVILSKLISEIAPEDISGQIIFLPMANFPAAAAGLRVSPIDEGNLNRAFPGDPQGTVTQQIAHYIEEELIARVDYLLDLHSGGSSLNYLPSMLMAWDEQDPRNGQRLGLMRAFALENAMLFPRSEEGYFSSAAAARKGAIAMTTELGGAGTVVPEILRTADEGLRRALAWIGVWEKGAVGCPTAKPPRFLNVEAKHYLYAREAGLMEPLVELGDFVEPGTPAAAIHHPETPGKAATLVAFETEGLVLCQRVPARVERGDCLFHLAEPRSDQG